MHCVASYPVPLEQANISAIRTLKARYPDIVPGYSDHTVGIDAVSYAVATGARIIEKHFTIDNNYSDFRDHRLSANPDDFRTMVDNIRRIEQITGAGLIEIQNCERETKDLLRRSIVAAVDLAKNTTLTIDHLTWVRPGYGLAPGNEADLIGRTLARPVSKGEIINYGDLKPN